MLALPARQTHIVVLAAHPDDETLGAGGLIAAAARAGHRLTIVMASNGERSHPGSRTHTPAMLADIRAAEAEAAIATLAPGARLMLLGLPDGDLSRHVDRIRSQLSRTLVSGADHWLLTTWAGDRHPDHAACSAAARAFAARTPDVRVWEFPIWYWHWGDPADHAVLAPQALRAFSITPADAAARAEALAVYTSQSQPLSAAPGDEPVLTSAMLSHQRRDRELLVDVGEHPAGDPAYFDGLYARSEDPWGLADRWYERRKRSVVMASLPRPRFRRVFEPGCATGLLSEQLAARSDHLVCWDSSGFAVTATCARLGHPDAEADAEADAGVAVEMKVEVAQARIPQEWPSGAFDLIVLSEVGYYCADLRALARRVAGSLAADGVLALCHWRHTARDHPHTAESVHATLIASTGLEPIMRHSEQDFLLELLVPDASR